MWLGVCLLLGAPPSLPAACVRRSEFVHFWSQWFARWFSGLLMALLVKCTPQRRRACADFSNGASVDNSMSVAGTDASYPPQQLRLTGCAFVIA